MFDCIPQKHQAGLQRGEWLHLFHTLDGYGAGYVVLADLQAWLDGAHAMTWQAAGVFMHSDALVDSPVEKMDLVPTAALQEARAMTQRIGVEAPRTHRGSRQWLQRWRRRRRRRRLRLRRLRPGGLWMEGGGYMARPARRRTRNRKPWLPF